MQLISLTLPPQEPIVRVIYLRKYGQASSNSVVGLALRRPGEQ